MTRRTLVVAAVKSLGVLCVPGVARATMGDASLLASGMRLNWSDPLARGLQWWLLSVPGFQGGTTLRELTRQSPGTLTNMDVPASATSGNARVTLRRGAFGETRFAGAGSLDYVSIADHATLRRAVPFTICCFFRPTSFALPGGLLSKHVAAGNWQSYEMYVTTAGLVGNVVQNSVHGGFPSWVTTTAVVINTWNHIAFVFRRITGVAGDVDIYLNGRLNTSTFTANGYNSSWTPQYSTDSVNLGVRSTDTLSDYFVGMLDDVRFYRWALPSPAIAALYKNALQGYPGLLNRQYMDGYVASVVGVSPVRKRGQVF